MYIKSIQKVVYFTALIFSTHHLSMAQYVSMQADIRPKIDKSIRHSFQVLVSPNNKNPLNFKLIVNNPAKQLLAVNLTNLAGKSFQDDIFYRRPNYLMDLDVGKLEDGSYVLSIKANDDISEKNIEISTQELGTRNGNMYLERKVEIADKPANIYGNILLHLLSLK
jgi:hypothetical protein